MRHDDPVWKTAFGVLLKRTMSDYMLDYNQYCEQYHVTPAAFRYWERGTRLPQLENLEDLQDFLRNSMSGDDRQGEMIRQDIFDFMSKQGLGDYAIRMNGIYPNARDYIAEALLFYYNAAKHKIGGDEVMDDIAPPTNKVKAVVFDFDGTLTKDKINRTTWESLWVSAGYEVKECQQLHQRFNNKEINHPQWCRLTEEKFKAGGLDREMVKGIAKKIHLIPGVKQVFSELRDRDIKIYIVSGSILYVIQNVLGRYSCYVDRIQANIFKFKEDGRLDQIIGTQYDFEGKSKFIREIARELNISPKDILFVGNSINDQFAYQSGARTLCINPALTDPGNKTIWHHYIQSCEDLREILPFIIGDNA